MTARRTLGIAAALALAPALCTALLADPAAAHGAMDNPISRSAACGEDTSQYAQSAACQAARAGSGGRPIDWPNLRVPNVNGRDRQVIPDGKLCSGGKPEFAGLDMARADWPTTRLTSGARFTFTYRETIPHQGGFRLYVTKDGYDPARPLRWADLESAPFLTVADPPLRGDAYTFRGRLPANKRGRHLIYTIWQNTSTPDTYYSCSDVLFTSTASGSGSAARVPAKPAAPPAAVPAISPSGEPAAAEPPPVTSSAPGEPTPTAVAVATRNSRSTSLPLVVGAAAALLALTGTALVALVRRRRQT